MEVSPVDPQLASTLRAWDLRRRQREALIALPRGLLLGLLVAALVALASRLQPWLTNQQVATRALILCMAGLVGALARQITSRRGLLAQARFADSQFDLQERMSTAVEVQTGLLAADASLARSQLEDALRASAGVDLQRLLPLQLSWRDWLLIVFGAGLLVLAVLLPNPQSSLIEQRQAIRNAIRVQAVAVEELLQSVAGDEALSVEQRTQLSEPLASALGALDERDLSQEQAVAALSQAEAELRSLASESDPSSLRQPLEVAGAALTEQAESRPLGDALVAGDLSGSAAAARELADSLSTMDRGAQAELSESLKEAADTLGDADPNLSRQLMDASQALADNDARAAESALREASERLGDLAQAGAAADRAEALAEAVGQARSEMAEAGGELADASPSSEGAPGSVSQEGGAAGFDAGPGQDEPGSAAGIPAAGGGHVENVFIPPSANTEADNGEFIELPATCLAEPSECGPLLSETPTEFTSEESLVPYSQVLNQYRDAAYRAIEPDYVPLGLKTLVRDYFSSLEP